MVIRIRAVLWKGLRYLSGLRAMEGLGRYHEIDTRSVHANSTTTLMDDDETRNRFRGRGDEFGR